MSRDMLFSVPEIVQREFVAFGKQGSSYRIVDGEVMGRSSSVWFTNIEHGKRHQELPLMTMDDNIKFSKHKQIKDVGYQTYDNYDAIEVPFTDAIPNDYDGVMGVPISFLDKYNPVQFEILGASDNGAVAEELKLPHSKKHNEPFVNGSKVYKRIFIRSRFTK
jgi:hypothetical protein